MALARLFILPLLALTLAACMETQQEPGHSAEEDARHGEGEGTDGM